MPVTSTVKTPYSSVMPYISNLPDTPDEYDAQRLASYDFYDDLYNNERDILEDNLRGENEDPVGIPTAKRIINTISRFIGKGWGFTVNQAAGTPEERQIATDAFTALFVRERMNSQFIAGKKEWLRRGDWVWYITADPDKNEGSRISIRQVDPRSFFPMFDEDDPDKIVGVRLVEEFLPEGAEESVTKVQTWLKPSSPEYDEAWLPYIGYGAQYMPNDDPFGGDPLETLVPMEALTGITNLPMYHIRNNESSGNPFGRSDLSGLESPILAINQAASDEDLSLAMAGLGMFWTDSVRPTNDEGEEVDWEIGPARFLEVAEGKKINRLSGVDSVDPSQTHISYIENAAMATLGINSATLGSVGQVSISESGVALAVRMAPILDMADEKDLAINDIMSHMFYDLQEWFSTYEGISWGAAVVTSTTQSGERLPFDRGSRITELMNLYNAGAIPLGYLQERLAAELGYDFSGTMLEDTIADNERKARLADPYAAVAQTTAGIATTPEEVSDEATGQTA